MPAGLPKYTPGGVSHLEALRQLETLVYADFDFEGFYAKLVHFLETDLNPKPGEPLAFGQLREVDTWVRKYFDGKLPMVETWIVRGFVLGKLIEAEERGAWPTRSIDITKLPARVRQAAAEFGLTIKETRALDWAVSHGAQHLTDATSRTVSQVQQTLFNNIRDRQGYRALRRDLEREFFDDAREINRGWKRVAITETNNAFNQGYVAQAGAGSWVVGFSMPDACPHCLEMINGKTYPVIDPGETMDYGDLEPGHPDYEHKAWLWANAIWLGKDNWSRSGSTRKRVNKFGGNAAENLVEREHHERYMPTIPMHPYCRCRWVKINPETMYVEGGVMRMRVMNPQAWQAWYDREVLPKIERLRK